MKRTLWTSLSLGAMLVFAAASVHGQSSLTISASQDNTLYEESAGALSNGAGDYFFSGTTAQAANTLRRGLVQFDVAAALPADATITSARLDLQMSKTISGSFDFSLHPVTQAWGEGATHAQNEEGIGEATMAGDVSWIHTFFDGAFWATPGGDFGAASASTAVVDEGPYSWGSTVGMVADVQGWLTTPATNYGWILIGGETMTITAKRFNSRENSDLGSRPTLTVEFTSPTAIFLSNFETGDCTDWSSTAGSATC